ncbi:MAG: hypothetical protein AAGD14_00710 [Planctomycetota bacterium]
MKNFALLGLILALVACGDKAEDSTAPGGSGADKLMKDASDKAGDMAGSAEMKTVTLKIEGMT